MVSYSPCPVCLCGWNGEAWSVESQQWYWGEAKFKLILKPNKNIVFLDFLKNIWPTMLRLGCYICLSRAAEYYLIDTFNKIKWIIADFIVSICPRDQWHLHLHFCFIELLILKGSSLISGDLWKALLNGGLLHGTDILANIKGLCSVVLNLLREFDMFLNNAIFLRM